MSEGHVVQTVLELLAIILLVIGFYKEKEIIEFEQKIVEKIGELKNPLKKCKAETYSEYIKRTIPNGEYIVEKYCVNTFFVKEGAPCPVDKDGCILNCKECWNLRMERNSKKDDEI